MALKIFNAATAWVLSTLPASVKPAHRQWSNLGRNGEDGADGLLADDPLNMPLHRRVTDDSFNGKLHASNHAHDDLRQTAVAKPRRCNIFATDSSAYGFVLAGILLTSAVVFAWHRWLATPLEFFDRALLPCGVDTFYAINNHTCTTGNFLCPVVDRHRSLRCGDACYLPSMHRCLGNELSPIIADNPDRHAVADDADSAGCDAQFLRLSDGLFENYFLSDCSSSSQVVVTSPTPKDQHDLGDSRLLFAWAAGNSGIVMFFQSQGGPKNATTMRIRHGDGHNHTLTPLVSGVSGTLDLLLPATLGMTILGSVRSLRDFTEGGRVWDSDVQDGLHFKPLAGGGLLIKRQWLDQTTETFVTLRPSKDNPGRIRVRKQDIYLPSGGYDFQAWHNYPFVRNLGASHILNSYHQQLIDAQPDQVSSLSFLSYNDKITAGAWRFLTYFGRDSLLSLLLSQPILSEGETGIIEIILSTVLERINAADGSVCHEEVIGDYATLLNKREGLDSADPRCDYKMVDTDFLLPIALEAYLVKSSIGRERATDFLAKKATFLATNRGISYSDLALATINKVMKDTEAFEQEPVAKNLIRIRNGESVGQWRDSSDGLGGGRTPYDVNTALVPAALQAISSLAKHGIISNDDDWFTLAKARANFWEENTLHFFRVQIPPEGAQALMDEYTSYSEYTGPEAVPRFSNNVTFHGVALRQASDDSVVPVMNTDDCFRLFLLKPTHDEQLSSFLQQAADNILTSFPVGLSTPLGLVVSNPAYAGDARLAGALTTGAYHGTVVWSWQMAMMAAGLGRQLARCEIEKLAFCTNKDLLRRVEVTYSHLWDLIDANRDHLDREVWSWTYGPDEKFHYAPLGTLPGPGGQSAVESNVQQLWSLAFLALRRNDTLIHGVE